MGRVREVTGHVASMACPSAAGAGSISPPPPAAASGPTGKAGKQCGNATLEVSLGMPNFQLGAAGGGPVV
jgi:hypothetical protein